MLVAAVAALSIQAETVRVLDREVFVRAPNYDEAKIAPYTLEDPLTFLDGRKVTKENWAERRKEILGIFAKEKHVPVYSVTDNAVTVKVGSVEHPMTDAHRIEWIAIETENGNQRKELKAGDKPEATFALVPYDKVKSVYEYCNLHGLWKA